MGEFRWSRHQARQKQDRFSVIKSCRIQAGLRDGLILIQSSVDGGSRFTVKAAIELNRLLGVIYPVKTDMHRDDYGANKKIIEDGLRGLLDRKSIMIIDT